MSFLDLFKRKKASAAQPETGADRLERYAAELASRPDYLLEAVTARDAARTAVKAGEYDKAWRLLHEQKSAYLKHAKRCNFDAQQTLALDGTVNFDLANVLRLEGKHQEALVHIVYWCLTDREPLNKGQQQKLRAYFNRCKVEGMTLEQATAEIEGISGLADWNVARELVSGWVAKTKQS